MEGKKIHGTVFDVEGEMIVEEQLIDSYYLINEKKTTSQKREDRKKG